MKTDSQKHLKHILAATLPLFIAIGCASNNSKITQVDPQTTTESVQTTDEPITPKLHPGAIDHPTIEFYEEVPSSPEDEAVALALANMEAYVKQLEEEKFVEAVAPKAKIGDEAIAEIEVSPLNNVTEAESISVTQMSDEELLVNEIMGTTVDIISETYNSEGKTILPPPQQMVFHFDSGKSTLNESTHQAIKAHADYLKRNANYILVISGHADNQGSSQNNQRISELRAQNIADMLLAEGIDKSQLRISGMGDGVPMISPDNWAENRRVEFVYQDTMMATAR